MSDKNVFEQTLTMMGESQDISLRSTINPILPSRMAPVSTADMGLTLPSVETLPDLNINPVGEGKGEFKILGVVGTGGMGVVELAHQHSLRRDVVIKRPFEKEATPNQIQALVKEGILTGYLEHPNIVPVHFLGRMTNGHPALVMKRISGTSWREMLYNPEHPAWEKVQGDRVAWHLRVLLQVSNAVEFAHSQGVIHRDIKPENVMLGDFGEVYLLDWGIGLKLDGRDDVRPKYFAGTPAYMAPEMLGGVLTPQTDIYLLGATLHEVLTMTPRHNGQRIDEVTWQAQRSEPIEYSAEIPRELAAICNQATHRDPKKRYPDVRAFREALEEHLEHRNAIHLVNTAQLRLETLQDRVNQGVDNIDTTERIQLHEIATECRFALREALKIWPDAEQARESLQTCTTLMASIELTLGNIPSVELLLAELDTVPQEMSERLAQLRTEQAESSEAQQKLRSMEHNIDNRVGLSRRSMLLAALAFVVVATASTYTLLSGKIVITTPLAGFATGSTIIIACIVVAYYFRDVLMQTALNRNMTAIFFAGCAGVTLSRLMPFFLNTPVESTFMVDMIVIGVSFGIAGLTQEIRLLWGALFCGLGFAVSAINPSWSYIVLVISLVLAVLSVSLVWSRGAPYPGGR